MSFGGGSGSSSIAGSTDVVLNSPANSQVLGYNASLSKWQNQTPATGSTVSDVLSVKDYGAMVDGGTDDSAAWVAAIAAANAKGCAIYLPAGTSVINRATFLPDITGLGTSICGDPSGESIMRFTAAGGGISIGNGSSYVYATKLTNLKVNGNGVCHTPIRIRMSEEACFRNLWVVSAAVACIDVISATSLFTSQRLTLSNSPVGMRFAGSTGYVSYFQSNFYQISQVFQVVGTQISRMVFIDGWTEACDDFITIDTGSAGVGFNQLLIKDSYFLSTIAATRLFRIITSGTGVNLMSLRVADCTFNYTTSNVPLIDTTAVSITSDTHMSLSDLVINAPAFGSQVVVKPHASQAWYTYYVDAQRIKGIPTNQWSSPPAVTGGVRSAPSDLWGTGTPEGVETAFIGSTYRRLDGGAGTSFYVKQSGTGNTGWVAK